MDSPLLVNKLRIPPATGQLVDRPRLVDALERGVSNHKLVLVAAAAGYGKSTLLAQWARASSFPVAPSSSRHAIPIAPCPAPPSALSPSQALCTAS